MKKIVTLLSVSGLLLVACGGEEADTSADEPAEETEQVEGVDTQETTETEEESTDESDDEIRSEEDSAGTTEESEIGALTNVSGNIAVDETIENGPFSITVEHARTSQLQPADNYIDMFGGEDVAMVSFNVSVTNNSEDTNVIHPAQGIMVTDTGNQVDANLLMSDDVGGDFYGQVTKTGAVHFIFDGNAEDIQNARYIISSGSDENYERFGEDVEFSVDF